MAKASNKSFCMRVPWKRRRNASGNNIAGRMKPARTMPERLVILIAAV